MKTNLKRILPLLFVSYFTNGCGLLLSEKSAQDISRPSVGFLQSHTDPKPELRPYTVYLNQLEDNREKKTDLFIDRDAEIPLLFPSFKVSSTLPPSRVITDAIAEHLKHKGLTVSEGSNVNQVEPLAVKVDGKLWRFDVVNVWVQIRALDTSGNVIGKEMIKSSSSAATRTKNKTESLGEHWAKSLRMHIDYVALQSTLQILNTQAKLTASLIEKSPEKIETLNLNQASLKALSQAIQETSEDFETLSMKMSVSEEAARAEKAARDQQIQGLMNLQNSLDGVRAALPAK